MWTESWQMLPLRCLYDDADIDECAKANGGCDPNATCTNNDRSVTCTCNAGYAGDGFNCSGK